MGCYTITGYHPPPPPLSILSCCTNCLQYIPSSALYVSSRSTAKSTTSSPSWICLALLRTLFAFSSLHLCFAMISAWAFSLFLSDADSFPSNYKNSPIKYTLVMSILKSAQNEVFLMTRASVSYWSMQEMKKKKTIGKKVNRNVSTSPGWDDITQTQALYHLPPLSLRRDETGDKGNRAWDQGWFIPWYWNKHKHLLLFSHIIQESWSPWYLGVKSGQFIPLKSPTCMKESAWRLPTFK